MRLATSLAPAALTLAALLLAACQQRPPTEAAAPVPAPTPVAALDTPKPDYPASLACAGIGGKTVLSLTIGTDGRPANVRLVQGSGQAALDASAQAAVQGWQFAAATRGGQPVAQTIQVPVNFTPPTVRPDECFRLDEQRQE